MKQPLITVITAVYNGAAYIESTIRSILNQTVNDFEYIIIDDASTDDSVQKILSFNDSRIKLIQNLSNKKLVETRNIGLAAASGRYVALIDHDDIALKYRFEEQLKYLEADPELVLVGCLAEDIDEYGLKIESRIVRTDSPSQLKARLLFRNSIVNSTLLFRRNIECEMRYHVNFPLSEDYDFIERISHFGKICVVPKVLVQYRIHSNNYSNLANSDVIKFATRVKQRQLLKLGIIPSEVELLLHSKFEHVSSSINVEFNHFAPEWIATLLKANQKSCVYDKDSFRFVAYSELVTVAEHVAKQGAISFFFQNIVLIKALFKNPAAAFRVALKLPTGIILAAWKLFKDTLYK